MVGISNWKHVQIIKKEYVVADNEAMDKWMNKPIKEPTE